MFNTKYLNTNCPHCGHPQIIETKEFVPYPGQVYYSIPDTTTWHICQNFICHQSWININQYAHTQ